MGVLAQARSCTIAINRLISLLAASVLLIAAFSLVIVQISRPIVGSHDTKWYKVG